MVSGPQEPGVCGPLEIPYTHAGVLGSSGRLMCILTTEPSLQPPESFYLAVIIPSEGGDRKGKLRSRLPETLLRQVRGYTTGGCLDLKQSDLWYTSHNQIHGLVLLL